MSHDEFISYIYSRLSTIISSDPLFFDVHCHPSKISFSKLNQVEHGQLISISIRRFDQSLINVNVAEDARVFQLKRTVQKTFSNKKINWKNIWKRYVLITDDHQQLINDNQRIEQYGIHNNCELSFVRRRRIK